MLVAILDTLSLCFVAFDFRRLWRQFMFKLNKSLINATTRLLHPLVKIKVSNARVNLDAVPIFKKLAAQ